MRELSEAPYIIQLAAILYDGRQDVASMSVYTVPECRGEIEPIPKEKFFIDQGLTDEFIAAHGMSYRVALPFFNNMVRQTDRIVAHNIDFDDVLLKAAYSRIAAPQDVYRSKSLFCTMKSLTQELKIPGKYGYKWPTLDESYRALVNPDGFEGAHDALIDVRACAAVLWATEDRNIDLEQHQGRF
jgi:DNA polymerase III epsilon subunit-like protein